MIRFHHGLEAISLQAGDLWASAPAGATYRDTPAEELQSIVRDIEAGMPWRDAVAHRYASGNPWLLQIVTSPARDLFFRLFPPSPGAAILDVGAGWGQLALPFARSGRSVTALEPTPERLAFIRAAASQEGIARQIHFIQADSFDVEFASRFDLVTCVGVLEWLPKFRAGEPRAVQADFLRRVRRLLNPGGSLVVGIENRLGLKYVLGAPDDHLGVPGIAVYDAGIASRKWLAYGGQILRSFTYTRFELEQLLTEAGFRHLRFFAALPDYKLPERILPLDPPSTLDEYYLQGNFASEHDGSNGHPLPFQDELRSHYLSLTQLGISHAFAPSYFITAS
jgi:2-polyprenyl-3-methyl-5-hydroxy-6-metoxy-1,4-benzoquinol methylase